MKKLMTIAVFLSFAAGVSAADFSDLQSFTPSDVMTAAPEADLPEPAALPRQTDMEQVFEIWIKRTSEDSWADQKDETLVSEALENMIKTSDDRPALIINRVRLNELMADCVKKVAEYKGRITLSKLEHGSSIWSIRFFYPEYKDVSDEEIIKQGMELSSSLFEYKGLKAGLARVRDAEKRLQKDISLYQSEGVRYETRRPLFEKKLGLVDARLAELR